MHRLCTFELDLDCGHCVTVWLNGWYPVSIACCDRLGGSWFAGEFFPFSSSVDYVRCLSERYEDRPAGSARERTVLFSRRERTDGHRARATSAGAGADVTQLPEPVAGPNVEVARTGTPAPTPAVSASFRGRPAGGALAPLLLAHLSRFPDGEFTPHDLARVLGRSGGAVRTRLLRLLESGEVIRTRDRPARFRIAPPAS